jgi:hypothetical protein
MKLFVTLSAIPEPDKPIAEFPYATGEDLAAVLSAAVIAYNTHFIVRDYHGATVRLAVCRTRPFLLPDEAGDFALYYSTGEELVMTSRHATRGETEEFLSVALDPWYRDVWLEYQPARLRNMVFRVASPTKTWPDIHHEHGRELSIFFPAGHRCQQVNYGQGEGQVLIDDNMWGFYWAPEGSLEVVLHDTELPSGQAEEVVSAICDKLAVTVNSHFTWRLLAIRHPDFPSTEDLD